MEKINNLSEYINNMKRERGNKILLNFSFYGEIVKKSIIQP